MPASTTPAPSVTWIDNGFDMHGLPAVTADGTRIVVAEIDSDGGRGNPNLRIVARDRSDGIDEKITILEVDEVDAMFDKDGRHPQLDARISAANTWLASLHRSSNLIGLSKLELEGSDVYTQHSARAGGVVLDWTKDVVTIRRDQQLVTSHPSPAIWHAADNGRCSNPAKLGNAWVDLDRKLALVEIAYNGTDTCWEPSAQHHVISW
ncbi:hypothetical protein BH11MYX3_BH11MYX3_38230 [soil metagenome]